MNEIEIRLSPEVINTLLLGGSYRIESSPYQTYFLTMDQQGEEDQRDRLRGVLDVLMVKGVVDGK